VAHYAHGKQKRTKTRKEKTQESQEVVVQHQLTRDPPRFFFSREERSRRSRVNPSTETLLTFLLMIGRIPVAPTVRTLRFSEMHSPSFRFSAIQFAQEFLRFVREFRQQFPGKNSFRPDFSAFLLHVLQDARNPGLRKFI
jgi:hypothetical protein